MTNFENPLKRLAGMGYGASADQVKEFVLYRYWECLRQNETVHNMTLNESQENADERFCPVIFDALLCWPRTPAGTVVKQHCPDFVEGYNKNFFAHKTCLPDGTWYRHPETHIPWTNYTRCVDMQDLEFRQVVNELYVKGYIVSLITLIISLGIFLGFKSLRCTRIRIHIHLFSSLALNCIAWILWYKLIVEVPENIRTNPTWCIGLHLLLHYLMLANYFWMFCEGLHLHLVLVVVFVKDNVVMKCFTVLGWITPLVFVAIYGVARAYHPTDAAHCWMEDSELMWLLTAPVCISLIASCIFLINVVRVLVKKLHPCSAQPAQLAIRKAVRATIILVPLFGLQHLLLPFRPDHGTDLERIYQLASAVLISLQGFCVSSLFCFANHDVVFTIRSALSRFIPNVVPPVPGGSNTGQLATLSRDIGV
ncbi:unnamed protein product [Hermetia illucens]|uniref:Calcitonin receptor n=1 Tax=Hermetia illucens TaxID=343691 RepID=A0A7R8YZW9_HERIL|nr:calcitonin gene-related peptide type 1 receptor [Hermetia illucens]XP_037916416.1 calcitonin gene-related peptide type 1 receptor [Hermetia illucens]XP_037916417.1 calcitonin gene-related peptide type 1 receptor [Hermetia illucens]CAD7088171.1 unnamed protein product [Hermetia illucens]